MRVVAAPSLAGVPVTLRIAQGIAAMVGMLLAGGAPDRRAVGPARYHVTCTCASQPTSGAAAHAAITVGQLEPRRATPTA